MNREIRRSKKGLTKEFKHKLVIAGLQVMTNEKIPDGVMVVSPKEGERLAQMIADATANQKPVNHKEGENNGTI